MFAALRFQLHSDAIKVEFMNFAIIIAHQLYGRYRMTKAELPGVTLGAASTVDNFAFQ